MAAIDNSQQILHAAHGFAEKERLPDVFEYLTKYLLLEQPEDPFTCIIERISKVKASLEEDGSLPTEMSSKRPSEASSQQYMEKHNVEQIFEELLTSVLYTKPENPLDALVAECERAAKARDAGSKNEPKFFTFDDLKGMFSLFDPTGRGVISRAQVQTGLDNLGLKNTTLTSEEMATASPQGFSQEAFVKLAMQRLQAEKLL